MYIYMITENIFLNYHDLFISVHAKQIVIKMMYKIYLFYNKVQFLKEYMIFITR
jgi:hypothetical protein